MLFDRGHAKSAVWDAAIEGQRVLVLGESVPAARHIQREVLDILPEGFPAEVRFASGAQSITFPSSGTIRFLSVRSSLRGCTFDQVFAPAGTPQDVREDIHIMLATSQVGQLTEYGRHPTEPRSTE